MSSVSVNDAKVLGEALWKDYDIKQAGIIYDQSLTMKEKQDALKEVNEERLRGFNKIWEGIIPEQNPFDAD